MKENEYGLYKYVHPEYGVIYIGLSTNSILNRIYGHSREEHFKPYLRESKIFYCTLPNKTVTQAYEKLLIDKYKPMLNTIDVRDTTSNLYFEEPKWFPIETHPKAKNPKSGTPICACRDVPDGFIPEDDGYDTQEYLFWRYRGRIIFWATIEEAATKTYEEILENYQIYI